LGREKGNFPILYFKCEYVKEAPTMSTREWPISYWHYTPGVSSLIQMMKGAFKCMKCGDVKEGETVLISTDTNKLRIAETLAGAAYALGALPIIIMIPPVGVHGAQLPEPVVAAFRTADVFLQPSTWSQTHTRARVEAIKAGKRGNTMCEVTEDALCVGAIEADYEASIGWAHPGCSPPRRPRQE
jgi:hypothetical protein